MKTGISIILLLIVATGGIVFLMDSPSMHESTNMFTPYHNRNHEQAILEPVAFIEPEALNTELNDPVAVNKPMTLKDNIESIVKDAINDNIQKAISQEMSRKQAEENQ